jgi:hypothetical protein
MVPFSQLENQIPKAVASLTTASPRDFLVKINLTPYCSIIKVTTNLDDHQVAVKRETLFQSAKHHKLDKVAEFLRGLDQMPI